MSTFTWPVRVYYEDTDAGGVVFYANYLKFMERARTEWLRAVGYEQDALRERRGILFAVRRVVIDYLAPARLDECLSVTSRLVRAGGASLEFDQQVMRQSDGFCCCRGVVKIACLHADTLRPARLPGDLLSELLPFASGPAEPLP
ncbi:MULTISPECIES: tol-pal system-associated acyl-CoA thioesterase [unclassified Thiocapsa]|uniref:tol-pal system-associated acyl-CoA thioesterase n=1 Tax=unclassified Thiocapsa TaxID=2641286 RepID=UPI0035B024CD